MQLESSKKTVNHSAQYIFENLTEIKNFEKLMPENTSKFEVIDENCFVFGLKGMPEIKLVKNQQHLIMRLFSEQQAVNYHLHLPLRLMKSTLITAMCSYFLKVNSTP